jgi:two-component system response regulator PilR (NtrC family)
VDGEALSLPARVLADRRVVGRQRGRALPTDLAAYLDEVERAILVRALRQHGFNRTAAGASLGLSLRQMRYRMARLAITEGNDGPTAETP